MQLYLAACKLLETLCTLPCGYVSQFQVYVFFFFFLNMFFVYYLFFFLLYRCRWAFVSALSSNSIFDVFVPFAVRINSLLNLKVKIKKKKYLF